MDGSFDRGRDILVSVGAEGLRWVVDEFEALELPVRDRRMRYFKSACCRRLRGSGARFRGASGSKI